MILLPDCKCCGESCCPDAELSETVTLQLGEVPAGYTPGPDLVKITLESCSGSGAYAAATAPHGDPDTKKGPITALRLDAKGSGYAILGREEPNLTVSGSGNGISAEWTFSLNDETDCITWSVLSASVTDGGLGWTDGEFVTLTASEPGTTITPGDATLLTKRVAPTIELSIVSDGGTGAAISPTLTKGTDASGRAAWAVTGVTVDLPGSGYVDGDEISLSLVNGEQTFGSYFAGTVTVDEDGGVTDATIASGGEYFKQTDEAESLTVGTPGEFYLENSKLPPIVPEITAKITQLLPSDGTGATFTPTVDASLTSPTFGQITGIEIDDGGTGYLAYELFESLDCAKWWNERTVVLEPMPSSLKCGRRAYGCHWVAVAGVGGDSASAYVANDLVVGGIPFNAYGATSPITKCDDFSIGMVSAADLTATLSDGGTFQAGVTPIGPQTVQVTFRGKTQGGTRIDPACGSTGGQFPCDVFCYPQSTYTYPADAFGQCNAGSVSSSYCGVYGINSVGASVCAAEGSTSTIPVVFLGSQNSSFATQYRDASCSLSLRFNCPCRYTAESVAIDEEFGEGEEIDWPFVGTKPKWTCRRLSVWSAKEPIQVADNTDAWPGVGQFEWRLLYSIVSFSRYTPYGTSWRPVFTSGGVPFQTGYQDFGALRSPDDLPTGEGVWQKGWWDRVSGYCGIGAGDIFPSGDPDVSWTINWGTGNVPS